MLKFSEVLKPAKRELGITRTATRLLMAFLTLGGLTLSACAAAAPDNPLPPQLTQVPLDSSHRIDVNMDSAYWSLNQNILRTVEYAITQMTATSGFPGIKMQTAHGDELFTLALRPQNHGPATLNIFDQANKAQYLPQGSQPFASTLYYPGSGHLVESFIALFGPKDDFSSSLEFRTDTLLELNEKAVITEAFNEDMEITKSDLRPISYGDTIGIGGELDLAANIVAREMNDLLQAEPCTQIAAFYPDFQTKGPDGQTNLITGTEINLICNRLQQTLREQPRGDLLVPLSK